jgi:hypothetical protein
MRKPPELQVEEIGSDRFPDLHTAQDAALPLISEHLQTLLRDLLEHGVLVIIDGKIIPNPNNSDQVSPKYPER